MSPPRYAPAQISLLRLLPSVTSFLTFILGMLLLFAGTQRQFLPQADLLTVRLLFSGFFWSRWLMVRGF